MNIFKRHLCRLCVLCFCLSIFASSALAAEYTLYRYNNEDGVPVINSTIPAHYAQNGYEIINAAGQVIKAVPPAPSNADIEKAEKEQKALAAYKVLKRRYSSVNDIENAKQRKLANIDTNISILNGTIRNLTSNINLLVSRAAEQERAGRKVHQGILTQLEASKAELQISEDLLQYRQDEYLETTKKYDYDIRAFIYGEKLEKLQKEKDQ